MTLIRISRARAAALLAAITAAFVSPSSARAQTGASLRIGILPIESASEVYYAKDEGFFAKAGLDADIQPMQNTPSIAAAVVAGAIDVGYVTIDSIASIHEHQIPLVVIAPTIDFVYPTSSGAAGVVVPQSSPIHTAKDLDGKTVAIPALHSLGTTAISAWMDQNGGDSASVKYVEIPFPAIPAALDAGRIDAAFLVEPFYGASLKRDRVITDGYSAVSKHWLLGTWVTTSQWAKDHPDVVSRFAAVIHETAVWANRNQAESGAILAKYTKIDPAVIASMARNHYAEQLTPALMQPGIDASAKYNGFSSFPAQELLFAPSR